MALDMIVKSLDEVDESLHEHYTKRDDVFQLDAKGVFSEVDRNKLTKSLGSEREDHKETKKRLAVFGDLDAESFGTLVSEHEQRGLEIETFGKDGKNDPEAQDRLIESRVRAKMGPHERELKVITKERDTLKTENVGLVREATEGEIKRTVLKAFGKKDLGTNPDAKEDVELWSERVFEKDDSGKIVSKDGVGVTPGLAPADVFKDMRDNGQRPLWFGETVGGGAKGSSRTKDQGDNPFKKNKEGRPNNMQACSAVITADRARARRLAKKAEVLEYFPMLKEDKS
jgi:hypothetical protein